MTPQNPRTPQNAASALDVLLEIELPVTLRFGKTRMLFGEVASLAPGSPIPFESAPDEPVDILVNGRLVARGEVVMAGGNYAVRLTEVSSRKERINSSAPRKEIL
jgi:flagellar motor switch protein FliN/FliY